MNKYKEMEIGDKQTVLINGKEIEVECVDRILVDGYVMVVTNEREV